MATTHEIVILPDHTISTVQHERRQLYLDINTMDRNSVTLNPPTKNSLGQRWDVVATKDSPEIVRIMNRKNKKFLGLVEGSAKGLQFLPDDSQDNAQKWSLPLNNQGYHTLWNQFIDAEITVEFELAIFPVAAIKRFDGRLGNRKGVENAFAAECTLDVVWHIWGLCGSGYGFSSMARRVG
jgi:hypothetical protein